MGGPVWSGLIVSTHPHATNRSPPPKLSRVVAVAKTISRIPILAPRIRREASDQATNLRARLLLRAIGRDHGIGARTLFRVGRLARQDRLESRRRHPLPREHTRPLHQFGRGDDHDLVYTPVAAGCEQKRDT